ncbi:Uncharacterised protein [Raoultella ornithinolytica]|nr:Uncharacterised protein [Raoultella ornithinolytica]
MFSFGFRQHTINHQILIFQANLSQFLMSADDFLQCRILQSCNQNQAGTFRIGQSLYRMSILLTLLFQPGHWAKTGSTIWITFNEATPGTGKLEQTNRVARRRCIKNDVIKAGQQGSVC